MVPLEPLLFRGESESLDFKRDQYPFAGASDDQKAKLLKDILSMANSWRTETAHILIGVDAAPGAPVTVVGIKENMDDASLQQFVNSKTQRPVEFRYSEKTHSGKTVGVIEIPVQRRPLHLLANYSGLRANTVYLRRGSSNAEASPDEIARMGSVTPEIGDTDLEVAFAIPSGRKIVGASLKIDCVMLRVAESDDVPDYTEGVSNYYAGAGMGVNRDYFRELVEYVATTTLFRAAALTVTNRGKAAAKGVRVEFTIEDLDHDIHFLEESQFPKEKPTKRYFPVYANVPNAIAEAMKVPPFEAEYVDGNWYVAFNLGTLQPARTLFPAIPFYVGGTVSRTVKITGRVLAENLSPPSECYLEIAISLTEKVTDLDKLEAEFD